MFRSAISVIMLRLEPLKTSVKYGLDLKGFCLGPQYSRIKIYFYQSLVSVGGKPLFNSAS